MYKEGSFGQQGEDALCQPEKEEGERVASGRFNEEVESHLGQILARDRIFSLLS